MLIISNCRDSKRYKTLTVNLRGLSMWAKWSGFWRVGHPYDKVIKNGLDVQILASKIDASAKFIFDVVSRLALITVLMAAQLLTRSTELYWLWSMLVWVLSAWVSYTFLKIISPWSRRATTLRSALVSTAVTLLLAWGAGSFISRVSLALLEATPALQAIKSLEHEILVYEELLKDADARINALQQQHEIDRNEYEKLDARAREIERIIVEKDSTK